ncbi:putative quinol monooxygenase [Vibrio hepatarius]|uniref:putative quinol monooxygenase n=1 Tax=Vibrio hepatarius TaxID=171383 RepID=UPI003735839F
MSMYCIVVSNRVKEGKEKEYLAIMQENAKSSVSNEVGCIQFDVLEDTSNPQLFHLYEIYQSPEALAEHKTTPHYLSSREKLANIVVEQSVIRSNVVMMNSKK